MSWFNNAKSSSGGDGKNFYPVTSSLSGYGKLTEKDTAWTCASNKGFQTETQVWYTILPDGCWVMVQIIWSYLGVFLVPATTQMTFKHYNPHTKKAVWKSVNTSALKTDGRSSKTDAFEVVQSGSPTTEETYKITANLDKTVQISVTYTRPADAPGFKLGDGPDGGFSFFGKDPSDGKRDGLVVHRFLPFLKSSGTIVIDGKAIDVGGEAMLVHAIQGMRPDSLASRWNFAYFTSGGGFEDSKLGTVRAVQMEFSTTDSYGPKGAKSGRTKVNIGAVYSSTVPNPLIVVGQTHTPPGSESYPALNDDVSSATHSSPVHDKFTGYNAPGAIEFQWEGKRVDGKGKASAKVSVDKLGAELGEGGLIEKVDVLAEIPYIIRKGLAAVTGTKPYIFQYLNPATLDVEVDGETVPVKGWLFNEASFVSE
ncbi:putative cell survival pathways protein [Saitozyma podzolica]|uniref:Putative cell survival pathways protein n=1 Tax=Saitozyma podzolica TaxID=1890683 RepID=A0A427Y847_9TREE|nr:putative cell survival pathways protein [Saitozyma podzolica]